MHLKTNVFCAAGIVLPDKAGRQISLAGWSGAAGYAVRFYTPDGSPGVNGKNDWEEDIKYVKLQVKSYLSCTSYIKWRDSSVLGGTTRLLSLQMALSLPSVAKMELAAGFHNQIWKFFQSLMEEILSLPLIGCLGRIPTICIRF